MAGHGGSRPGAGAPRGGISETKRLLLRGLKRGLTYAGRDKGLTGSDEEVAVDAVAHITRDLILSGSGRDVLAILAQCTPKGEEGDPNNESPLLKALNRMPGASSVPPSSRLPVIPDKDSAETAEESHPATDPQSVAPPGSPFFAPQFPLIGPDLEPRAGAARVASSGRGDPLPPLPSTAPPGLPGQKKS